MPHQFSHCSKHKMRLVHLEHLPHVVDASHHKHLDHSAQCPDDGLFRSADFRHSQWTQKWCIHVPMAFGSSKKYIFRFTSFWAGKLPKLSTLHLKLLKHFTIPVENIIKMRKMSRFWTPISGKCGKIHNNNSHQHSQSKFTGRVDYGLQTGVYQTLKTG